MNGEPIVESGMVFGPFLEGLCFHIEKSVTYQKVKEGVKMAEFLLVRSGQPPSVLVVEAKSSSHMPQTQPNFDAFIDDIRENLTNALSLGLAACLKRHEAADAELSAPFKALDLSTTRFYLVLVIAGHEDGWLPPLRDALTRALRPTLKTWALGPSPVLVYNEGLARRYGLVLSNADNQR